MATPYVPGVLAQRWTVNQPTTKTELDRARVQGDYIRYALGGSGGVPFVQWDDSGSNAIFLSDDSGTTKPVRFDLDAPADSLVLDATGQLTLTSAAAKADGVYQQKVYSNQNEQESALSYIHSDNASSDHGSTEVAGEGGVQVIQNDGTGAALALGNSTASVPHIRYRSTFTSGTPSAGNFMGSAFEGLADDSVMTPFGTSIMGFLRVSINNGSYGIFGFNSGAPSISIVAQAGTTTFAVTTDDVTGTTKVDGQFTISCRSGVVEFENRSGATAVGTWDVFSR